MVDLKLSSARPDPAWSERIRLLRVLSIFFMVYVHVKPGFDGVDWEPGSLTYVAGILLVDVLGRALDKLRIIVTAQLLCFQYIYAACKIIRIVIIFYFRQILIIALVNSQAVNIIKKMYKGITDRWNSNSKKVVFRVSSRIS